MEITFQLYPHCIETGAKRAYEKCLRRYFQKGSPETEKRMLENQIAALKLFLEKTDFGYLRSTYPDLNGTSRLSVTLSISKHQGDVRIRYHDIVIDLEQNQGSGGG